MVKSDPIPKVSKMLQHLVKNPVGMCADKMPRETFC